MADEQQPKISVQMSLSPSTYNFANPTPPTLSLTIESHSTRPFTIFTWGTPFDPRLSLTQVCFTTTDLNTNTTVPQSQTRIQRAPFSRARGSHDEQYFLTLTPQAPTTIYTPFSRAFGVPPQPKAIVERGWELDEQGNELKIRRSRLACGVDGLEPGHRYQVDVVRDKMEDVWWCWGTRDDVLVDQGSLDWGLQSAPVADVRLDVGGVDSVEFAVDG